LEGKKYSLFFFVELSMKTKYIFILAWSLFILACQDGQLVEEELPSGLLVKYHVDQETGEKEGEYLLMTPEGEVIEKSHYVNGQLQGQRTIYTDSGTVEMVELYEAGMLEGEYKGYYPSGEVKYEGTYVNNKMKGVWTYYYESGAIKEKVAFEDNLENGPFEEYDPDGTLRAKGHYLEGDNEHGILYLYSEEGEPQRVMDCKMGVCITQWTPDSTEVNFNDFQ